MRELAVGPTLFRGQKPTDYGQNGMNIALAVCCERNSNFYNDLNGGCLMRHFYFRLILGVVWIVAAVFSVVSVNIPFAALYVVLSIVFLRSAYSIRKKEKGEDKEG